VLSLSSFDYRGPNWIHGTKDNPIFDLVKETNTTYGSLGDIQAVLRPDGSRVPEKLAAESSKTLWDTIAEAFAFSNDKSASIPANDSLMDFLVQEIPKKIRQSLSTSTNQCKDSPIEDDTIHEADVQERIELVLSMAGMWGPFVGSETANQSLRFLWLEECLEGENPFCAGTYSKVLETISRPAKEQADIKLRCKAVRVRSTRETTGAQTVTVETNDGSTFEFDEVVVTSPLGWLKKNLSFFEPPVPGRLQQAVESLGYGHLDKVYVTFQTAFWDEEANTSTSASTTSSAPSTSDDASTTPYPPVTTFLDPPSTNPYTQDAISLSQLPAPHAHPTLLFYTTAKITKQISALLPPSTPYTSINPHNTPLLPFIHNHIRHLPNYNASSPSCMPIAVLATNWAADELAGNGSYTFFPVGLEAGDEDVRTLRWGMPERGVWIAGEHAAPFVALGTVTGAWWSGDAVARRILGIVEEEDK
jgi:Flavin containing amine oxidoreductase